jgi:hypothetical protein
MRPTLHSFVRAAVPALAALAVAGAADAGLFRAYISVNGLDANPCTLQQPCRLLPRAINVIDAGGEVWMLDSANYNTGPMIISKSVSVLATPGTLGSIIGTGGVALMVNAPGGEIALRNLKIRNLDSDQSAIMVLQASKLTIDRCEITGFSTADRGGVLVWAPTETLIVDSLVRDNNVGVWFDYGATATISRTTFSGNGNAIYAKPSNASTTSVSVADSLLSANTYGAYMWSTAADHVVRFTATRTVAVNNHSYGFTNSCAAGNGCYMAIQSSVSSENQRGFYNNGGTMIVSGSTANGNTDYGFYHAAAGGVFRSTGDNTLSENGTADTFGVITSLTPR